VIDTHFPHRIERLRIVAMKAAFQHALDSFNTLNKDTAKAHILEEIGRLEDLEFALDQKLEPTKPQRIVECCRCEQVDGDSPLCAIHRFLRPSDVLPIQKRCSHE
jgi:hypothetical protein